MNKIMTKDIYDGVPVYSEYEVKHKDPYATIKKKCYSQSYEDGIIEVLISKIGSINKFFVEFGGWDGYHFSNTANLRENFNWGGILFEADKNKITEKSKTLNTHCEFLTSQNINDIFNSYDIPKDLGLLSIDIDSNDIYLFEALNNNYKPSLLIIEYNVGLPNYIPIRIIEDNGNLRRGYYNSNLNDMYDVGVSKGYSVVTTTDTNVIFIRSDLFPRLNINMPTKDEIMTFNDKKNSKAKRFWERRIKNCNDTWLTS